MSALTDAKKAATPGTTWTVTNHYLTREDHPCYGRTVRTVERVTTSRVYFANGSYVDWPKAAQVERDGNGTVRLFGGGIGQQPTDLFLTLVPASTAAQDAPPPRLVPGFGFTHESRLDPDWVPGPGQKYADAPKLRMRVTRVTAGGVYFKAATGTDRSVFLNRPTFEARYLPTAEPQEGRQ